MSPRTCRQRSLHIVRLLVLVLAALTLSSAAAPAAGAGFQQLPAPDALLQFTSHDHILGFRTGEFYLSNGSYALRVEFVDGYPIAPSSDTPAAENGASAPPLGTVMYANLWNGITLSYEGSRGLVSSSYHLEPRADVHAIHLRYNAPVVLNGDGTLTIAFATGSLTESAPFAWQEIAGERVPVRIAFELRGEREVGFAIGAYDTRLALFIDPMLTWNTFVGGGSTDQMGIAVDASGNAYVVGSSFASWGSPIRPFTVSPYGFDVSVAKLNPNGALLWNTFLGGSSLDAAQGVAADGNGNVYVVGYSLASWDSPIQSFTGTQDAFVAKLSSSGELVWNTFLGGLGTDDGRAVTTDADGNLYVTGTSTATWGSPVRAYTGGGDAFVAKLSSDGAVTWNTFLGSSSADAGWAVAVDGSGSTYLAGYSMATWGSPIRPFTLSVGDAFVAELNSNGELTWNTFLGGSESDTGTSVAVDGEGNVYVAGGSHGTWGSPIRSFSNGADTNGFAAKLTFSGALVWNTFLDGIDGGFAYGVAIDREGDVLVAGVSNGTWGSPVRPYTAESDAYAAKLSSAGILQWNAFLGGAGNDCAWGIAIHGDGSAYIMGYSTVTWGSPVRPMTEYLDAFVAQIGVFDVHLPVIGK